MNILKIWLRAGGVISIFLGALVIAMEVFSHHDAEAFGRYDNLADLAEVLTGGAVIFFLIATFTAYLAFVDKSEHGKNVDVPDETRWSRRPPNELDFAKRNLEDDFRKIQAEVNNEQWYYGDYPAPLPKKR